MSAVNLYNNTIATMNSRLDVVLWSKNKSTSLDDVFLQIENIVTEVELMLSMYDSNAEVYKLNNNAFVKPLKVSKKLFRIIEKCISYYNDTKGYFNIGYKASGIARLNLAEQLLLDTKAKTISFTSKEVQLDFGGIGKGIALRQVGKLLKEVNISNAFISFGGSSIITRGRHPYGDFWPLALEDGKNTSLELNDHAVSISGFHQQNGKIETHITDPKTGELKHRLKLVEVKMNCPIEAEVLSTAILVAPEKEHQYIINAFKPELCIRIPLDDGI